MIKVKVKIASNEELMRSGGRKRNKIILSSLRKREKGIDLRFIWPVA